MLNVISALIGIVALVAALVAFIPLLGWLNWLVIPVVAIGLVLGLFSDKTTGRNINLTGLVIAMFRLFIGGGLFRPPEPGTRLGLFVRPATRDRWHNGWRSEWRQPRCY